MMRTAWKLHRRRTLTMLAALVGGSSLSISRLPPSSAAHPKLELLKYAYLTKGTRVKNTLVGGLSGLSYDARRGLWYALSDDRGCHGPPRCYVFRLPDLHDNVHQQPEWVDAIVLQPPAQMSWSVGEIDPEAVALRQHPHTSATTLLWTSEGNIRTHVPPAFYESSLEGTLLRHIPLPPLLCEISSGSRGGQNNRTLEGLSVTADSRYAWLAMEGALKQDRSTAWDGQTIAPCRFTRIELAQGKADLQVTYLPEPMPFGLTLPSGATDNGVAELLVIDDHRLWVLERAWTPATGVSVRLYEADTRGATNTLSYDTLAHNHYRPCSKRLLLDFSLCGLPDIDNFEAMALGPPLRDGRATLLACTDDNFSPFQVTQFAVFAISF